MFSFAVRNPPFPLLHLPLLAIQEVIKSSDVREIFLMALLSARFRRLLRSSIPKSSSLEVDFKFQNTDLIISLKAKNFDPTPLSPKLFSKFKIGNTFLPTRFSSFNNRVVCIWSPLGSLERNEKIMRQIFCYFTETFNYPSLSFYFDEATRESFAMKLIGLCREQGSQPRKIDFRLKTASPQSIREILNGFVGKDGCLRITTQLPRDFDYTSPSGGFKLKRFHAKNGDWVNPNDFLQCESVEIDGDLLHMTPEYVKSIFKTIVNTECRITHLRLTSTSFNSSSFPEMIIGLIKRW
ncbi:unnamed protein product [Caenorhabditis brenneri]